MSTSIANIRGAHVTRLVLEQFGSNEASTVLQNQLLSDSKTFDVTIERFNISSDIPIFPANTHVFDIINTDGKTTGDQLYAAGTPFVSCKIGPVYNWLDFAYQIQVFLSNVNYIAHAPQLHIEGSVIAQKSLSFNGNDDFWRDYILHFKGDFAEIFDLGTHPVIWARTANVTHELVRSNTAFHMLNDADASIFTNVVELGFTRPGTIVLSKSRMDLFENRHKIRIDSVLPLPHELFAVGKPNSTEVSHRYTFFEFDFPKETLFTRMTILNDMISDNNQLSQVLCTGVFQLIKPSPHSGLKKLNPGQSQFQRYEIFLVRRKPVKGGGIEFVEEKWPMSAGDYFRLALLFTQEV